ncbi:hypothetical protein E1262_01665 [Jiangella aurantiaca]|uniref:exo-alpha-sialidase n=1 Tax=Jiangella aurantiaca TaxID=2530373 RepID=A0A4R5AL48_9ACTN|nr:sialidase family protein [Jiangella aurantiaca]TDD72595.1 hypothetical protein E1262_01665 [Jiangella aurantiaca]
MDGIRRRDLLKATGVVGGASILALAGLPRTAGAAAAGNVEQITVFERGETDAYHTFRIPVLVRATDGTMLAFAQGRVENAEDFGHIQLVLKRSADGGRTWGPLQVVAADPPHRIANQSVVVDRTTGRIHLFFVRTSGDVTDQDIVDGTVSPEDAPRPFVVHSDDHGVTWSPRREITDDVKLPQMRHYVGGPTHGIQLAHGPHAGRLLMPGNHNVLPATADRPAVVGIHTIYSDDHGETWRLGGALGAYGDGIVVPNETAVVELEDGTVYFNTRDHQGTAPGNRAAATSSDGGRTLDGPFEIVPDLETPIVSASLFQQGRRTDRSERIIFSAPWHPSSRERLTLWSSLDAGATWGLSQVVYDGPAGYSDLAAVDDDTLGVLYENGPRLSDAAPLTYHQCISIARIPLITLDRPVPAPAVTPDESGDGNHAVVSGTPRRVRGVFGRALELAGDYVELPYDPSIDVADLPFTAALWFRTGAPRQQRIMHAYNNGGFPQWFIEYVPSSGVLRARMRTAAGDTTAETAADVGDGAWHHVAVRRGDQHVWTLYLDGEPVASAQADAGSVSANFLAGIRVGARMDGINHPFVGAVDEVYLFDRALSATQIRDLARSNTMPAGGAVCHLPLDVVR